MRSRWLHTPILRETQIEKTSSWLEILYDLVFVSSFVQLSTQTARAFVSPHAFASLVLFGVVFSALWFSWTGFTFFSTRVDVDDLIHRVLIFAQMLAVIGVSTSASDVLNENFFAFSMCFAAAQAIIALLYLRGYLQTKEARPISGYWALVFGAGAAVWAIAAWFPSPWVYLAWFAGAIVLVAGTFAPPARREIINGQLDRERMVRRYGFFTLAILGEMFLQVMISVGWREGAFGERMWTLSFALLFTFSIWWIYFDDLASSSLRKRKFFLNYWLFAHLPMHAAIFTSGVALLRLMSADATTDLTATRWLLSTSVAVIFLALAFIDWITDRAQTSLNARSRIAARLAASALTLLIASLGQGLGASWFLAFVAITCCLQVLLDLLLAPGQLTKGVMSARPLAELVRAADSPSELPRPMRVGEAIRKNTPRELQSDLYSYFIDSSWSRFLAFITVGYLLINLFFAGLYMLEPGGISNARPDSFADAFYFSVQTYATIGYGQLSPMSDFTNVIVVIEAAVGIASVALVTGLMFTKASKPRPGILFSQPVLITKMNGHPHLMFRAGNTRSNELVSAEITVSYLRDEISTEGHHTRRMHDLNLVRARSPYFALSWLVLHEIDEHSPFYGIETAKEIADCVLSLSCVLTAHDSTYGQTIYARHVYYPEDFHIGERFADVTSQLPDGRLVLDYGKFHDTEPV